VSVTREQVLDALRGVAEPCSLAMRTPMDICEMGLVEGVEIESGHVTVTLVLTDPSCVHFTGMRRFIEDELLALAGVTRVAVAMSTRTLWTPDRVRRRAPAPS
jgi:metal-sulfur cluster biosynthetic enzyme